MVSQKSVNKQLKRIGVNRNGWGRGEFNELAKVLLPDEEIYECANGLYEGGFALLVATDVRVLLIDKKPLNYLTVEDLRFDMINEIDYSHRLLGARISISAGSKNLQFRSYNQPRLRKLINHVQHCMAEAKKKESSNQEDQSSHLEKINKQLQEYLIAQQEHQLQLRKLQEDPQAAPSQEMLEPVKPGNELADYLLAQQLIARHERELKGKSGDDTNADEEQDIASPQLRLDLATTPDTPSHTDAPAAHAEASTTASSNPEDAQLSDIYAAGMQEVFGKQQAVPTGPKQHTDAPAKSEALAAMETPEATPKSTMSTTSPLPLLLDLNPLKIAYSKLPMALRNRKFGRPSFHAHSQAPLPTQSTDITSAPAR